MKHQLHPSVMFEREIYDKIGGYDKNFEPAEDYQLWIKFIKKGYFIDNIRKNYLIIEFTLALLIKSKTTNQ